jgi:hypothetical protein
MLELREGWRTWFREADSPVAKAPDGANPHASDFPA